VLVYVLYIYVCIKDTESGVVSGIFHTPSQPDSGCILQEILYTDGTPVASINIVFPYTYLNNEKIIQWNKMLTNSYIQI